MTSVNSPLSGKDAHGSRQVLYVIDTFNVGGAEKSTFELARCLRAFRPTLCRLYEGDPPQAEVLKPGVSTTWLHLRGQWDLRAGIRRLVRLIRKLRPSVVHSTLFRSDLIARIACAQTRTPLICSLVSDSYGEERFRDFAPRMKLKMRTVQFVDAATAAIPDLFIANSEAVRDAACGALHIESSRVVVIPRGRDPSPFLAAARDGSRARLRRELGAGDEERVIVHVGRHTAAKGLADLLDALPLVSAKQRAFSLWLVGDGELRGALEQRARRLGLADRVRFLGMRTDVPDVLAAADIFVFPSRYEGFPGALLEAKMAGLAIVAADTPTNRAVVDDRSSVLVPPRDPIGLAAAISDLIKNPAHASRLGATAREDALARFTLSGVAARYEDEYRRLCALRQSA